MCLIVFAWKAKPEITFFAASNRDEFYARETEAAHAWPDAPYIYAGRDKEGGGTWLGVSKGPDGKTRFAALTNVRTPHLEKPDAPTRGNLPAGFLRSGLSPSEYIAEIRKSCWAYNGFNLLCGTEDELVWFSNYGLAHPMNGRPLKPGIYGLSNALLDDAWPKVTKARAQFASLVMTGAPREAYFEMLSDASRPSDDQLPQTFVSMEWERLLSSVFIRSELYGTRSSTLVEIRPDEPPVLTERIIR